MFNLSNLPIIARLMGTASVIALMAACSGSFDPNGTFGGSVQIGPDGKPVFSFTGDFMVGGNSKETPEAKQTEKEEAAKKAAIDNVVYLFHKGTIRDRLVDPEIIMTLSKIRILPQKQQTPAFKKHTLKGGKQHNEQQLKWLGRQG